MEIEIVNNIINYFPDMTVIFITHREQILEFMDKVVFMKNGEIIKIAKHVDLLSDDEYKNFWKSIGKTGSA